MRIFLKCDHSDGYPKLVAKINLADTTTYALRDQSFPAPLQSLTVRASQLLPSKDNQ